ncbi:MAG: LysR family transcriptional regulator, partial [Proteobacteria bacterium]|nr:LysR family transcriptional regulator [Pseudomonadota bacterium]
YWLPERLARFAHAHPAIRLNILGGNTVQTAQAVIDGQAELGFVEGEVDNDLLSKKTVSEDRIAIFAAPDHPLSRKRIRAEDLAMAQWVLREEGSGTRAHFENAMRKAGIDCTTLGIAMTLPSNEAALAASAKSNLLTAVSELAAAPHLAAGLVVKLQFALAARRFEMLKHRARGESRAAIALVSLLSALADSPDQSRGPGRQDKS